MEEKQIQKYISDIKGLQYDLTCPIHSQKMIHLCNQSDESDNILKLICPLCVKDQGIKDCITYPEEFVVELNNALKYFKNNIIENPSNIKDELVLDMQFKHFTDYFQQSAVVLNNLKMGVQQLLSQIQTNLDQLKGIINEPLPKEKQFIEQILTSLTSSNSKEQISQIFYLLQKLRANPSSAFPLDFNKMKLLKDSSLDFFQFDDIQRGINQMQSAIFEFGNNTEFTKSQLKMENDVQLLNAFETKNFKMELKENIPNGLNSISNIVILDDNLAGCIGQQQGATLFTLFKFEVQFESIMELQIDKANATFGRWISKIDNQTILVGSHQKLYVVNFRDQKVEREIDTLINSPITCVYMDEPKHFYIGLKDQFQISKHVIGDTQSPIMVLYGHKGIINQLKVFRMNYLISGSDDQTIKFWNLIQNSMIGEIITEFPALCFTFTLDQANLIYGGNSKQLMIIPIEKDITQINKPAMLAEVPGSTLIYQIKRTDDGLFISTDGIGQKYYSFNQQQVLEISHNYTSEGTSMSIALRNQKASTLIMFCDHQTSNFVQILSH